MGCIWICSYLLIKKIKSVSNKPEEKSTNSVLYQTLKDFSRSFVLRVDSIKKRKKRFAVKQLALRTHKPQCFAWFFSLTRTITHVPLQGETPHAPNNPNQNANSQDQKLSRWTKSTALVPKKKKSFLMTSVSQQTTDAGKWSDIH